MLCNTTLYINHNTFLIIVMSYKKLRPSWSYGSWIYNYLCNHCPSPLKLSVRTPFMARCTRYNTM